jgi:hypothetical protein
MLHTVHEKYVSQVKILIKHKLTRSPNTGLLSNIRDNRRYIRHIVTHAEYDKLCKKYAKESEQ